MKGVENNVQQSRVETQSREPWGQKRKVWGSHRHPHSRGWRQIGEGSSHKTGSVAVLRDFCLGIRPWARKPQPTWTNPRRPCPGAAVKGERKGDRREN